MRKPAVLATCKVGSEAKACLELGDALFRLDEEVSAALTAFPGVVVVETSLSPYEALRALAATALSYVYKAYPLAALSEALAIAERALPSGSLVSAKCEVRGRQEKCSELLSAAEKALVERAGARLVEAKRAEYFLHIQGAGEVLGYAVLPRDCENFEKLSFDDLLRKRCLEFLDRALSSLARSRTWRRGPAW